MKKKGKIVCIVLIMLALAAIAAILALYTVPAINVIETPDKTSMKDAAMGFAQKPGGTVEQAVSIQYNQLYTDSLSKQSGEDGEDYFALPATTAKTIRVAIWLPDEKALETSGIIWGRPYYVDAAICLQSNGNEIKHIEGTALDKGRTVVFEYEFDKNLDANDANVLKLSREHDSSAPYYVMVGTAGTHSACKYQETMYDNGARVRICQECGSIEFVDCEMFLLEGKQSAYIELIAGTIKRVIVPILVILLSLFVLFALTPLRRSIQKARAHAIELKNDPNASEEVKEAARMEDF